MTEPPTGRGIGRACGVDRYAWTPSARWAARGLMRVAYPRTPSADPVGWADAVTSVHDWRIALCIAVGVPLDLIDPSGGYDLTRRTFGGAQ